MREDIHLQFSKEEVLSTLINLSPREKEVAKVIIEKKTIKGVAQMLKLSPNTVVRYACSLRYKLGVISTIQAAYKAQILGLLD